MTLMMNLLREEDTILMVTHPPDEDMTRIIHHQDVMILMSPLLDEGRNQILMLHLLGGRIVEILIPMRLHQENGRNRVTQMYPLQEHQRGAVTLIFPLQGRDGILIQIFP